MDDGIIADKAEELDQSMDDYCREVDFELGDESVKLEKKVNYKFYLQAIGFEFNLRKEVWRVGPKKRGLLKMYLALFMMLSLNFTDEKIIIKTQRRRLLQIASLLSWYAQVVPAGNSFVHSLYRNAGWGTDLSFVEIEANTKRDFYWWRMLILISLKNPNFFSAKISHLRINKSEDIILYTDASKRTGCGAWLSHCDGRIIEEGFIRRSKEEIELFEKRLISSDSNPQAGVSINVLEFFAVVYFVLIGRDKLKGCVVKTNCDNTVTVVWLKRMRASGQSWVSESLMKLFSLVCLKFDIVFISCHFAGLLNVHGDRLSRDISLQENFVPAGNIKYKDWWNGLSATEVSRNFLLRCILQQWDPPLQDLLKLLETLQ